MTTGEFSITAQVRMRRRGRLLRLASLVLVVLVAAFGFVCWRSVGVSQDDLQVVRDQHDSLRGVEEEIRRATTDERGSDRLAALDRARIRLEEKSLDFASGELDRILAEWANGADPRASSARAWTEIESIHSGLDRESARVETDLGRTLSRLYLLLLGSLGLALLALLILGRSRRVEARLESSEKRARHDTVSGGMNRRGILEQARHEWSRASRYGHGLAVLVVDLDRFKEVNDRHGHAAGDLVLRTVTERMREKLRPYDAVGRMGGDEFLVVLPDCDEKTAGEVAQRLVQALRVPIDLGFSRAEISASIGGSVGKADEGTLERMIERADGALYGVKRMGRNGWAIAPPATAGEATVSSKSPGGEAASGEVTGGV